MDVANPFRFAHVQNLNSVDDLMTGPCVVMAAPGMLQWCLDDCLTSGPRRNVMALLLPGIASKALSRSKS